MMKIKQAIANDTLRKVYLTSQHRSHRKQADAIKESAYLEVNCDTLH